MLRRLALILLPAFVLLAVACGDDGNGSAEPTAPGDGATATIETGATPTAEATTTEPPSSIPDGNDGDASEAFFSALDPSRFGDSAAPELLGQADPALEALLLQPGDLPAGYVSLGVFGGQESTPFGEVLLASNIFTTGDPDSGELGSTVMATVAQLPAGAPRDSVEYLDLPTEAELDELLSQSGVPGSPFGDVRRLDASGLGDEGFGVHMTMDLSALLDAFAPPDEAAPVPSAIGFDMYVWRHGDFALVLMVMWDDSTSAAVDARALAELMDGRAAEAR